jgi:hypothetical protein
MGCTEAQWLSWLPGAVGHHAWVLDDRRARVDVEAGRLLLEWQTLPARHIALVRIPRLRVEFRFDAVGEDARQRFMRYFDLYMHRGGG